MKKRARKATTTKTKTNVANKRLKIECWWQQCWMFVVVFMTYWTLLTWTTNVPGVCADNWEYKLVNDLLKNYDSSIRPSIRHNSTLNVTFGLALAQIIDVDERNMIITTNCWLNQGWIDFKLQWNPDDYDGIEFIHIPHERIWRPDILLVNNADSWAKISSISTNAIVKFNGNVTWLSTVIFKSSCSINVRFFPFDEQQCDMIFASWTFDGFFLDIDVNSNEGDVTNYIKNGEWHLVKLMATKLLKKYSCCDEPYPEIYYRLVIRRRPLFYVFNMVFPCMLITLVAFLGFYLPPGSTEKVSIGITTLLSITVFLMLVAESMPPTSEQLPLLGIYYAVTIGIVSFSTTMAVITLNVNNKGSNGRRVPAFVRTVFFEFMARILCTELSTSRKKYATTNMEFMQQSPSSSSLICEKSTNELRSLTNMIYDKRNGLINELNASQQIQQQQQQQEDSGIPQTQHSNHNHNHHHHHRHHHHRHRSHTKQPSSSLISRLAVNNNQTDFISPRTQSPILKHNRRKNMNNENVNNNNNNNGSYESLIVEECLTNQPIMSTFYIQPQQSRTPTPDRYHHQHQQFNPSRSRHENIVLRPYDLIVAATASSSSPANQHRSYSAEVRLPPPLPSSQPPIKLKQKNLRRQSSRNNSHRMLSKDRCRNVANHRRGGGPIDIDFVEKLDRTLERQFGPLVQQIMITLHKNEKRQTKKHALEKIENEWADVARVADHFFCYFFPIMTLLICGYIFFKSPYVLSNW